MAIAITLQPTVMSSWPPGTRHYQGSDGTNFAVESSIEAIPLPAVDVAVDELMKVVVGEVLPVKQVVRPTVVFECTEEGLAVSLTPIAKFPPATSHQAALEEMGYTTQ